MAYRHGGDSTEPNDIPLGLDFVAGYTDGRYANMPRLAERFPDILKVSISAIGRVPGNVIDAEPGCVWPESAVVLRFREFRAQGFEPTLYCSISKLYDLIHEFDAFGERRPVAVWTAHYTNRKHVCDRSCGFRIQDDVSIICTQYGGDLPGHYDLNWAVPHPGWPFVDEGHSGATGDTRPIINNLADLAALPKGSHWIGDEPDMIVGQDEQDGRIFLISGNTKLELPEGGGSDSNSPGHGNLYADLICGMTGQPELIRLNHDLLIRIPNAITD